MAKKDKVNLKARYRLEDGGRCVLENYQQAEPFSNFFPGIAGVWGIPMWVFYTNRGQCISCFGIESKDKAMLEFLPANKAYRMTTTQGFRTFVKVKTANKAEIWEPFRRFNQQKFKSQQRMIITSHDLTIEEDNKALGLVCRVQYFTLPEEPFAGLVRRVTFENTSSKERSLEVIDGLPVFLPYGMNDWLVKNMCRTVEAWVKVQKLEKRTPFYQLNVEVKDTPDVTHINEGNFYFVFEDGKSTLLPVIADPSCVFGQATDFLMPEQFLNAQNFRVPQKQHVKSRTPSAMTFTHFKLAAKQSHLVTSVMGFAHNVNELTKIVNRVTGKNYVDKKSLSNRDIISGIKNNAFTHSAYPIFNEYAGQTFLDNVMRGGLPVSMGTKDGPVAFNVFSRKHGDMERDYNYFLLAPTYFSQGNGNFRDVNQNRRNDVWFNTDVAQSSIETFFNLSQADGYNPLVVKGMSFFIDDKRALLRILKKSVSGEADGLKELFDKGFQPGELLSVIDQQGISLKVSKQEFLGEVLAACRKQTLADHGEGFWVDHWTYNIDLLESYLSIFPEKLHELLLGKRTFSFFHNDHYVLSRSQRYLLTDKGVRQYHSVFDGTKSIKAARGGYLLRTEDGDGDVYHTHLAEKLLCLIANKAATLDPDGIGIEMEADKPGWYDALNGLPGLLGSSICETFELKRYAQFLLDTLDSLGIDDHYEISLCDELGEFIKDLHEILSSQPKALEYWDKANEAKENYRLSVRKGIRGDEEGLSVGVIREFLRMTIDRIHSGVKKVKDKRGLFPTYFTYAVKTYEVLEDKHEGAPYVFPETFTRHNLPLFLEGIAHALRVERDPVQAMKLYKAVRTSGLFDKKLKMYKVNENLAGESEDIGRTRVFPRGWLENESIWIHMEYKYLLEFLRVGLYEEFYAAMKECMVPFLKAETYGRSVFENSSFIASSAHEDSDFHGQGFVARLSGSTAEFVHMWLWMNMGRNPFVVNHQNKLCLQFDPALAGEMFSKSKACVKRINKKEQWEELTLPKGTYAFHFLGATLVVYHNPARKDLFPTGHYQIEKILVREDSGKELVFTDGFIPSTCAQDVRDGKVERIDVFFA